MKAAGGRESKVDKATRWRRRDAKNQTEEARTSTTKLLFQIIGDDSHNSWLVSRINLWNRKIEFPTLTHSAISTITEEHLVVMDYTCSLTTHVCGEETPKKPFNV